MINFSKKNTIYTNSPFPLIICDDFIDEKIITNIKKELSASENLFHHHGWGGKRSSIQYGTNQYEIMLKTNKTMNDLHQTLISKNYLDLIFNYFSKDLSRFGLKKEFLKFNTIIYNKYKTDFIIGSSILKKVVLKFFYNPILRKYKLRRFIRKFNSLFFKPTIYPGVSFSKSIGGYSEIPHTDSRHKLFIGLLYLDELKSGGELTILKDKANSKLEDSKQYLEKEQRLIVKKIKPKKGRLVLFLNTNNAYHSVEKFQGLRRFVYFSFSLSNAESIFNTNYQVKISDVGPDGKI